MNYSLKKKKNLGKFRLRTRLRYKNKLKRNKKYNKIKSRRPRISLKFKKRKRMLYNKGSQKLTKSIKLRGFNNVYSVAKKRSKYIHDIRVTSTTGGVGIHTLDSFLCTRSIDCTEFKANSYLNSELATNLAEHFEDIFVTNDDLNSTLSGTLTSAALKVNKIKVSMSGNKNQTTQILSLYAPLHLTVSTHAALTNFFHMKKQDGVNPFAGFVANFLSMQPIVFCLQADGNIEYQVVALDFVVSSVDLAIDRKLDMAQSEVGMIVSRQQMFNLVRKYDFWNAYFNAFTKGQQGGHLSYFTGTIFYYNVNADTIFVQGPDGNYNTLNNYREVFTANIANLQGGLLDNANNALVRDMYTDMFYGQLDNGAHRKIRATIANTNVLNPDNLAPVRIVTVSELPVITFKNATLLRKVMTIASLCDIGLKNTFVAFICDIISTCALSNFFFMNTAERAQWKVNKFGSLLNYYLFLLNSEDVNVVRTNMLELIKRKVLLIKNVGQNESKLYIPRITDSLHFVAVPDHANSKFDYYMQRDYTPLLNLLNNGMDSDTLRNLLTPRARKLLLKLDPGLNFIVDPKNI